MEGNLKRIFKWGIPIWVSLVVFLIPVRSEASNAAGLEMHYEWLDTNTYLVTLKFYRDCHGVQAPTLATVNANSISCSTSASFPLPYLYDSILPLCLGLQTTCTGGIWPGLRIYVYQDTIVLPNPCSDWLLQYSYCCRTGAFTNLNNSGSTSGFVETPLNNTIQNNSPVMVLPNQHIICAGIPDTLTFSSTDPDGDSLGYELISARTGGGPAISYNPPYSGSNPMNGVTYFLPNGDLYVLPTTGLAQVVCIVVRVNEYRAGQWIGSIMRDFTIWVENMVCPYCIGTFVVGNSLESGFGFSLYPNPAQGVIFLQRAQSIQSGKMRVLLFDLLGKKAAEWELKAGKEWEILFPEGLEKGLYFIKVINQEGESLFTARYLY